MNTLPQTIKDYLEELETLDVRPIKGYFDNDVISWDLEHYGQETGEYEKIIDKLFREAFNDAFMMDNEHKTHLLSRLKKIEAKYKEFWGWYVIHNNAYNNGLFDAHQFAWDLPYFFKSDFTIETGLYTPQLYLTPTFFGGLQDAVMFKSSTVERFINELMPPPVATSTETNGKRKTGRTKDPETQKRNATIYAEFIRYTVVEKKTDSQAYDRLSRNYKQYFTGEGIKGQIRRIVRKQKQTQTDTN